MCARTLASSFRPSSSSSEWRRMKSQHERTRKESHGGWRSGEQREKQDLYSLYLYATHWSTLQRKKKRKNVHFSLSLWIHYLYGYVLYTTTYRREKYFALTFLVCSLVFSHMVIFHASLRSFFSFFFSVSSFSNHFIFCPFAVYSYKSWQPRVSYSPSFGGAIESLLSHSLYRFRSFSYFYLVRIFWLIELNARLFGSMDPILSL